MLLVLHTEHAYGTNTDLFDWVVVVTGLGGERPREEVLELASCPESTSTATHHGYRVVVAMPATASVCFPQPHLRRSVPSHTEMGREREMGRGRENGEGERGQSEWVCWTTSWALATAGTTTEVARPRPTPSQPSPWCFRWTSEQEDIDLCPGHRGDRWTEPLVARASPFTPVRAESCAHTHARTWAVCVIHVDNSNKDNNI